MITNTFRIADLLFQIKTLSDKVKEFESGEKHTRMKEECEQIHRADICTMLTLTSERTGHFRRQGGLRDFISHHGSPSDVPIF